MAVPDSPGQPCPVPCSFSRGLPQGTQVRPNEPDSFKQGVGGEGGGEPGGGAASGPGSLEGSGCSEGVRGSGGSGAGERRSPPPRPGNPQQAAAGGFCRDETAWASWLHTRAPGRPAVPSSPCSVPSTFSAAHASCTHACMRKAHRKAKGLKGAIPQREQEAAERRLEEDLGAEGFGGAVLAGGRPSVPASGSPPPRCRLALQNPRRTDIDVTDGADGGRGAGPRGPRRAWPPGGHRPLSLSRGTTGEDELGTQQSVEVPGVTWHEEKLSVLTEAPLPRLSPAGLQDKGDPICHLAERGGGGFSGETEPP